MRRILVLLIITTANAFGYNYKTLMQFEDTTAPLIALPPLRTLHEQPQIEETIAITTRENVQRDYGVAGLNTLMSIVSTLRRIGEASEVIYHPAQRVLEVTNSATLNRHVFQQALDDNEYYGWRPNIENERSSNGNLLITLVGVNLANPQSSDQDWWGRTDDPVDFTIQPFVRD